MSMTITGEGTCHHCGGPTVEVSAAAPFENAPRVVKGKRIVWCGSCETGWDVLPDNPFNDEREI